MKIFNVIKGAGKFAVTIIISPISILMAAPKFVKALFRKEDPRNLSLLPREERIAGMTDKFYSFLTLHYGTLIPLILINILIVSYDSIYNPEIKLIHPNALEYLGISSLSIHVMMSEAIGIVDVFANERGLSCLWDQIAFPFKRLFNIDARNFFGHSDLHRAVLSNDINEVSRLIGRGSNPLVLTGDSQNIIELADTDFIKQLQDVLSIDAFFKLEQECREHSLMRYGSNGTLSDVTEAYVSITVHTKPISIPRKPSHPSSHTEKKEDKAALSQEQSSSREKASKSSKTTSSSDKTAKTSIPSVPSRPLLSIFLGSRGSDPKLSDAGSASGAPSRAASRNSQKAGSLELSEATPLLIDKEKDGSQPNSGVKYSVSSY